MRDDSDTRAREIAELKERLAALEAAETPASQPSIEIEPPVAEDRLNAQIYALSAPPTAAAWDISNRRLLVIGGGAIGLIALLAMCTAPKPQKSEMLVSETLAQSTSSAQSNQTAPAMPPEPSYSWRYSKEMDSLTDKTAYHTCVDSTSRIELDWPYESQYPRLCIRQSPKFGSDVIVRLTEGGQFVCRSYDGCAIKVRFDDGPIQSFSMAEAADHSPDVLFVSNVNRFIAAMEKAKRVRLSAEFYQAGEQTMDFPVDGFDPAKAGLR